MSAYRTFGHELNGNAEESAEDETNADHSPPATGAWVGCRTNIASSDRNAISNEDTGCDEELVGCGESTSDSFGGRLGLVQRDGRRKSSDSKTSDEASDGDLIPGVEGCDLNDHSDGEDDALGAHSPSSSEPIGEGCS